MALDGNESNGPSSAGEIIQHNRYKKLLKRPLRKTIQEASFRFNNYVFTMAGSNTALVYIFRALFIFQIGFVSALPFNSDLWVKGSVSNRILNVLSVFAYIIPSGVSAKTFVIISLFLTVGYIVMMLVFIYSLYSFHKESKLHSILVYYCSILLTAIIPYIGTICFYFISRSITFITQGQQVSLCIAVIAISLFNGFFGLTIYSLTAAVFLSMRITSPSIQSFGYSFLYHLCQYLATFFLSLSTDYNKKYGIAYIAIGTVFIILSLLINFNNLIWQSTLAQDIHKSINSASIFGLIGISIKVLRRGTNTENELVIFIVVFLLFILFYRWLSKKRAAKMLTILDQMEQADSIDEDEKMKPKKLCSILFYGFFLGHPFTHSWRAFDLAEEKFPKNRDIMILLLRCVSIYPYESSRLRSALIRAASMKRHDYELKKLIAEGQTLLQQRERNLSKSLKKQLGKIKEKSDKCIGHIRHIWECIIRGSVSELESLSMQLKKMEDDVIKDYNQLLSIFSNNPYVVRAYATFLTDVACNQAEGSRYYNIYKSLRSGARVLNEKSYFFAIREFPTIPDDDAHSQMSAQKDIEEVTSGNIHQEKSAQSFVIGTIDQQWGEEENEVNNNGYIESLVNSIRLPSTKIFKAFVIVFFIIASLATVLPFIFVFRKRVSDSTNTFQAINRCVMTIANFLDGALLTFKVQLSDLYSMPQLNNFYHQVKGDFEGLPPKWTDDRTALRAVLKEGIKWNDLLEQSLPILKETEYFEKTLSNMVDPVYTFPFFTGMGEDGFPNTSVATPMNVSFQRLLTFYLNTMLTVLNSQGSQTMFNKDFYSIIFKVDDFVNISGKFIDGMIAEYNTMLDNLSTNIRFIPLIVGIIVIIINFTIFMLILRENNREKDLIYSSFKAIPKSAISNIITKLNMSMNKNIDDSEENKLSIQEENALRILSTSNTQKTFKGFEVAFLFVPVVIFFLSYIIIILLLFTVPNHTISTIKDVTAAFRSLMTIPFGFIDVIIAVFRFLLFWGPPIYQDQEEIVNIGLKFNPMYKDLLNILRVGKNFTGKGLNAIGDISNILSHSFCEEEDIKIGDLGVINCSSYETSTAIMQQSVFSMFKKAEAFNLQNNDEELLYALYFVDYKSNEQTIMPSFRTGFDTVENLVYTFKANMVFPCFVLLGIIVIFSLIAFVCIESISEHTLWTLKLLLFCPQNIILNSKILLKVLSNDFTSSTEDSFGHGASFYETLVSHLLNGTLFLDNQLTIKSANDAAENILGVKNEDILEKNLHDVLTPAPGKEAGLHAFFTAVDGAMTSLRSPNIECEAEILKGNETMTVQFNLVAVSISGEVQTQPTNAEGLAMLALVMKDLTSTIAARTLLREEHDKGEHLLNMILPQIIVKKLQKGESNISFSVQSASILFMDIVSFTPWCGSLPAATVMKTLNKLFAVFDKNLSRYDRMIKIKCIGDCYMAAGGIFDEVNQPAEHCKQAISFCLDAISSLEIFDVENHQSLRIRAGINCGGPIIAGVLGIEKPTFDILGPAISIAAMMEHNGVPMNVHIPQHMYELVYDQAFQFKERGDIEIKGKTIHTYLVTGYA